MRMLNARGDADAAAEQRERHTRRRRYDAIANATICHEPAPRCAMQRQQNAMMRYLRRQSDTPCQHSERAAERRRDAAIKSADLRARAPRCLFATSLFHYAILITRVLYALRRLFHARYLFSPLC
jgi:hypothetical protein